MTDFKFDNMLPVPVGKNMFKVSKIALEQRSDIEHIKHYLTDFKQVF